MSGPTGNPQYPPGRQGTREALPPLGPPQGSPWAAGAQSWLPRWGHMAPEGRAGQCPLPGAALCPQRLAVQWQRPVPGSLEAWRCPAGGVPGPRRREASRVLLLTASAKSETLSESPQAGPMQCLGPSLRWWIRVGQALIHRLEREPVPEGGP